MAAESDELDALEAQADLFTNIAVSAMMLAAASLILFIPSRRR